MKRKHIRIPSRYVLTYRNLRRCILSCPVTSCGGGVRPGFPGARTYARRHRPLALAPCLLWIDRAVQAAMAIAVAGWLVANGGRR
jgi:hypothetical protein